MPTGYTDSIYKGISFEDFVLNCSRAFGALIHMRDESSDAQITLPEPSDYHVNSLKKAHARLEALSQMSENRRKEGSRKKYEDAAEYQKKAQAERAEKRDQLEAMLAKVENWRPPTTDHVGLHSFMIKQIKETIEHDCCGFERYETPVVETPEEWYKNQVESAEHDIEYHEKHLREDSERNEKRRKWIIGLFESIGRGEQVKTLKTVKF
jgi:hypothetical protein